MSVEDGIKKRRKELARKGYAKEKPMFRTESSKRENKKKTQNKLYIGGGIFAFILLILLFSCSSPKGTIYYGICKVFVETNNVLYPSTIRYVTARQQRGSVRIDYLHNKSGKLTYDITECYFARDSKGNVVMTKALLNRRPIDSDIVKKFNTSIPIIISSDPDLTLPQRRIRSLYDMWEG